jgi:hypothetical protein
MDHCVVDDFHPLKHMAQREYIRLTRSHGRSGLAVIISWRSSLWLANDHLLCVDTNGYSENYKRFYFRDIQALSFRKTNRALIWTIVLSLLVGLSILIAIMSNIPGMNIVFSVIAGMFGLLLALHLVAGPSCVCHIRTAVQTEELPSLNRVRRARKVLNRLRPFIESAQGALPPEEVPIAMRELAAPYLSNPMSVSAGDPGP